MTEMPEFERTSAPGHAIVQNLPDLAGLFV